MFLSLRIPARPPLCHGILCGLGVTSWAYYSLTAYTTIPPPLDFLVTLLSYCVSIAPYTGAAAVVSSILLKRNQPWLRCLGIPAIWVCGEFIRSWVFLGFAWSFLGYTQYRNLPLIQIADVTGVYGLSFLLALSGYAAAECIQSFRRPHSAFSVPHSLFSVPHSSFFPALGTLAAGIALVLLYGTTRLAAYPSSAAVTQSVTAPTSGPKPVTVALARANVPSEQRWQRAHYARSFLQYMRLTQSALGDSRPDLVVWPEFAIGFYLDREYALRAQLARSVQHLQTHLLLGAPRMQTTQAGTHYYNSAYLFSPNGQLLDSYDKISLLPFFEYRPVAFPALLSRPADTPAETPEEFTPGQRATIFRLSDTHFGVVICYEITFPQLARRLAHDGAEFLVNISNDSWIARGGQAAVQQHFSLAVFRAVENKRPLVRVAAAGISAFIDPVGRPSKLSQQVEAVTLGSLIPQQTPTVYTQYGDWFAWSCFGVAGLALIAAVRSPARTANTLRVRASV